MEVRPVKLLKQGYPKVSILCACFNHASFLCKCLDGLLEQLTSVPIEIVIRDDCSTDGSIKILKEYQSRHEDVIRVIYEPYNKYLDGERALPKLWEAAKGEYLAICECDDYWTDPHKLQSQVDFMESHPDCVIVTHNAKVVTPKREMLFSTKPTRWIEKGELIQCRQFATASVCFGHDSVLENYVSIANNACIWANVRVGFGTHVGANASTREKNRHW